MKTLTAEARYEELIRKSRFVAYATRVDDLAATLSFYESVADPSANHNCWAWKLGHQYRSNDDGEPGGSAGRPILAAIEGKGLDNVMVIVTRYFGGTKLGIGGLVRAYGGCAARCLDRADIIEEQPTILASVKAGFEWSGAIHAALGAAGAEKLSEEFGVEGLLIRFSVSELELGLLRTSLQDATRGNAVVEEA